MFKNALVYCVPTDSSPMEKEIATRILAGSELPEVGTPGRVTAAQEIYKKLMGIKNTEHPITVEDTDILVPEPIPDTNTPVIEKYKTKVAKEAADGIAQAIVEATDRIRTERKKL